MPAIFRVNSSCTSRFTEWKPAIDRSTTTPATTEASLFKGGFLIALVAAIGLDWLLSELLPAGPEIALGTALLLLALLGLIRPFAASRLDGYRHFLGLTGFLILTDYIPSNFEFIGLSLAGIVLGIGFAAAPLRVPELRPHWRAWSAAGILLAAVIISGAFAIERFEVSQPDVVTCLWLLPPALLGCGFAVVFARAASLSGILPSNEDRDAEESRWPDWIDPHTIDLVRFLSPLPFVLIAIGLRAGSLLLHPEAGTAGVWIIALGAFLLGTGLIVTGIWRASWRSWIALGFLWGSIHTAATLLATPWIHIASLGASAVLLLGLILAALGRDMTRGVIPAKTGNEAMLAFTIPLGVFVATLTLLA